MQKRKGTGVFARIPGWLAALSGVMLIAIIAIVVFGEGAFSFAYKNKSALSSLALLPAALALACGWALWLSFGRATAVGRRDMVWLAVYQVALLAVQLVATRSLWYYTGWDIKYVYEAAEEIARTGVTTQGEYFAMCPNNAPIALMLTLPLWVGVRLGLAVPYAVLPYLCACVHNLTCLLTALCVRRLTGDRRAMWSAVAVMALWLGLHIYMTVPYTDVFSAFFVTLAIYILLGKLPLFAKTALFTFLCIFGTSIKPTVLILFIAGALLAAMRAIGRGSWDAKWRRRALAALAAAVLGFVPAKLWQDAATVKLAGSAVPETQHSAAHYIMIGQNNETLGGHSIDDITFTNSFATLKEREQANLRVAWERFTSRTPGENLRFYTIKLYKSFDDGTFAANKSLLDMGTPKRDDLPTRALRSVFHTKGKLNPVYCAVEQAVWLAVLMLCACACLLVRNKHRYVPLFALTLLGLIGYQLIFESWPRYLFLYAPLYLMLATLGARELGARLRARRSSPAER